MQLRQRHPAAVAIALVYLAIAIDLIRAFIPGLGHIDDALLVAWAIKHLIAPPATNASRSTGKANRKPSSGFFGSQVSAAEPTNCAVLTSGYKSAKLYLDES